MKLSRPQDQSEYFRWAEANHCARHKELVRRYDVFRYRFNGHTADDLLDELYNQHEILKMVVATLEPCMIKRIAMSRTEKSVAEIQDMIRLKGIVRELPSMEELKINSEVLELILESL